MENQQEIESNINIIIAETYKALLQTKQGKSTRKYFIFLSKHKIYIIYNL